MKLSIIIPTCGRQTLMRTLQSVVRGGIRKDDEVLVCGDGPQPVAAGICAQFSQYPIRYLEGPRTLCFGNAQRSCAQRQAQGDFVVYMDDDDEYTQGALTVMRDAASANPAAIHIFKMIHRTLGVIWKEPAVRCGNVSSQMVLVPNIKDRLAVWPEKYEGDYWFIRRTVDNWPGRDGAVCWQEAVVAIHHEVPEGGRR
jgi:glycosyltransferase involved in cell wall biosynthesis